LRDPVGVSDAQPDLRVSDADRQQVVDRLRDETASGRLTLDEFDERVGEAYAARTRSQLEHVMRELPAVWTPPNEPGVSASGSPASRPVLAADRAANAADIDLPPHLEERARRRYRASVRNEAAGFIAANGTCITVWAMTGGHYFWPAWVLMGTGIGLAKRALRGPETERRAVEREWRKQELRQQQAQAGS
jgi:hypothetical protein